MSAMSAGKYRISDGGQWVGSDSLLVKGDLLVIDNERPDSTKYSLVDLTIASGRLKGYTGALKFRVGEARAIGKIAPAGGAAGTVYAVAAEAIGILKTRSLRVVLIATAGSSLLRGGEEEGGGEWEGDEAP